MKIKWYGHASFRVTAADGTSIITDPYDPELAGYKPFTETADIVIVSSLNDPFHDKANLVPGTPQIINALELAQSGAPQVHKGITFSAIQAMEALNHPRHEPDQNGMYRFEVDGLSVAHMGDVGNPLSDEQMRFFEGVDVLLALAGGLPTIELDDLKDLIDHAKPRLVIPMHFRTLRYKPRNTLWIASFLNYFEDTAVEFALTSEVEITPEMFADNARILVMTYVS